MKRNGTVVFFCTPCSLISVNYHSLSITFIRVQFNVISKLNQSAFLSRFSPERMSTLIMDDYQSERNDSQSDETYTTPISPLSPQEKSPPPASLPSPPLHSNEQRNENNAVKEMQILIQSSADLTFPLQDSWTFWYFKNDRACDWKDNLIQITTICTVEAFWSVFNSLQVASRLGQGCDYFLFKNHIVSPLSKIERISSEEFSSDPCGKTRTIERGVVGR